MSNSPFDVENLSSDERVLLLTEVFWGSDHAQWIAQRGQFAQFIPVTKKEMQVLGDIINQNATVGRYDVEYSNSRTPEFNHLEAIGLVAPVYVKGGPYGEEYDGHHSTEIGHKVWTIYVQYNLPDQPISAYNE